MRKFLVSLLLVMGVLISSESGMSVAALLPTPAPALAAPGICTGPVCADGISRSAKHHWQLRLQVDDQRGHREKIVVDCRDGVVSPLAGPVDRRYVAAVTQRVCRLAGDIPVRTAERSFEK